MNKEEIRHFKSLLRQGSLRHMNIVLDDKFQKELLNVIKDYEDLQQRIDKVDKYINRLLNTDDPMYLDAVLITIREILGVKDENNT